MTEENLSKRLKILTVQEYKQYYSIPCFSTQEREEFFYFSEQEMNYIDSLKSRDSKLLAMLQIGYFKAKKRFFYINELTPPVISDITYLSNKFFMSIKSKTALPKRTQVRNKDDILKLFSYTEITENDFEQLSEVLNSFVSIDADPKYIFKELAKYLNFKRIIIPSYKEMQIIISKAIIDEEENIFCKIMASITPEIEEDIEKLLSKGENEYLFTHIKFSPTGLTYSDVYLEIKKKQAIKKIYEKARYILLQEINLTLPTIKYFYQEASIYNVYNLKELVKPRKYLYVLCFVFQKYITINDNLTKTFIYLMDKYNNNAKTSADKLIVTEKSKIDKNLKELGKLLNLYVDENIDDSIAFSKVKGIAYKILKKDKIRETAKALEYSDSYKDLYTWKEFDSLYGKIKKNLRFIFQNLDFNQYSNNKFFEAVIYMQEHFLERKKDFSEAPTNFISKKQRKHIFEPDSVTKRKEVNPKRYEMLVYKTLKNKVVSGDIFLEDTSEYKHLDSDLLEHEEVENSLKQLAQAYGLEHLMNLEKYIESKLDLLEEYIIETNQNILNDINKNFIFTDKKKEKTWKLEYEKVSTHEVNNLFFLNFPLVELVEVIRFVNNKTGFMNEFTHISSRFSAAIPNEQILLALIIAYGTNMGLNKMSSSSGISYAKLRNAKDNFLRENTIKHAVERINNAIVDFPIFKHYNVLEGIIHSSSDGQKYNISGKIFKARHSPKYFGLGKGISTITLSANYQPLSTKIISGNEYEGHHTLELLLMNESEIQPQIHSTDSHGLTNINFALHDFCGFQFAPRIIQINNKAQNIYSPRHPVYYPKNFIIKPSKKINKDLILSEIKNIKRIVASLIKKKSTVSIIVKKLCNSPKSNKTIKAISEYDKVIRSIHILKIINEPKFRQSIQIVLNRGEVLNHLKRATGYANLGKMKAKDDIGQFLFQGCNQLICNIIIFYNSYILSKFFEQKLSKKDYKQLELLKRVSPIAWQHINLYGKYDLQNKEISFDENTINKIIKSKKL